MSKMVFLFVVILLLLPLAVYAGDAECDSVCKTQGYNFGKCSGFLNGCGTQGWTWPGQVNACGSFEGKCCCARGVEDLTATGLCRWLVDSAVNSAGFTCDFSNLGERANYFCEDNQLKLECKDCWGGVLGIGAGCGAYHVYTLKTGPDGGLNCECGLDTNRDVCQGGEKVPQGSCVDTGGNPYWGYNGITAQPTSCNNNNQIDDGEQCDGTDLGGKTCYDFSAIGGVLKCDNCTFDTSQCVFDNGVILDNCDTPGETQCFGLALKECRNVGEHLDWVTIEPQSEECCDDGDCSEQRCNELGGAWMPGATTPDFAVHNYCCGDDGNSDLGTLNGNKLCVASPGYQWAIGEEGGRYVDNRILYCNSGFHICANATPYNNLQRAQYCDNLCHFYCDPTTADRWLPDTNPLVLSEVLGEGEKIDTQSTNLVGQLGCCPANWCWDGSVCIENQIDEPTNQYVYQHPSTSEPYRCEDGAWSPAHLVYSWDYSIRGYCPDADSQCLVGNNSYESNDHPEAFFSDEKPQCIRDGQYILDYYCKGNEWVSRTSMVGAKMLEADSVTSSSHFKLYCDQYSKLLNDYLYDAIGGKPVIDYLSSDCNLGDVGFPCVNNLCVMRNLDTGKVLFGASLNVPLFDPEHGFANALGITGCNSAMNPNEYLQCGANAIYNPNVSIIIFSNSGIGSSASASGWDLFKAIILNPLDSLRQLLLTGQLNFYSTTGLPLNFEVLNATRLFSKLYIGQLEGGETVQGYFESNRFDWTDMRYKYYLLVRYSGFNEDICQKVNAYTSPFGRINCEQQGGDYVVVDARDQATYLMSRWQDLTSKFKSQP